MKNENVENENPEVIDIPWEDLEELYKFKTTLSELEHQLAAMCLNFEKTKQSFLREIENTEHYINSTARELLNTKNVDETITYELKLPSSEGEKGYFIRK